MYSLINVLLYCTISCAATSLDYILPSDIRFKEKSYGSSGATSGLTSSLAFTPVQVRILFLELCCGSVLTRICFGTPKRVMKQFSCSIFSLLKPVMNPSSFSYVTSSTLCYYLTCLMVPFSLQDQVLCSLVGYIMYHDCVRAPCTLLLGHSRDAFNILQIWELTV